MKADGSVEAIPPGLTSLVGQSPGAHTSYSWGAGAGVGAVAAAVCLARPARQFPGHLNPAAGSAAGSTFPAVCHIQTGTGFRSGVNHLE